MILALEAHIKLTREAFSQIQTDLRRNTHQRNECANFYREVKCTISVFLVSYPVSYPHISVNIAL